MIKKIEYELFINILKPLIPFNEEVYHFLYEVYEYSIESVMSLHQNEVLPQDRFINQNELIFYIAGEYLYSVMNRNEEEIKKFIKDESIIYSMASVVTDKFVSLSAFNYQERNLGNRFLPPISSLNLYLNFMLNILNNYKKSDPRQTLVVDLLVKSVSYARSIALLLVNGYETEAFATWRTLHECECTLVILEKYEKVILDTYLEHMRYGLLFKKGHSDTPEEEALFLEIKENMRKHNLKSKDMKKFIEYGWLYNIPGVNEDETFKLNFRDGLEKVAKLSEYNERYEASSEIVHSTPILIYSSKEYYYFLTLLSLYESFFKLEAVFYNLFAVRVGEEQRKAYSEMKNVYYRQLINIYKREGEAFKTWHQNVVKSQKKNGK